MERINSSNPFRYEEWLKVLHRRNQGSDKHVIIRDRPEKTDVSKSSGKTEKLNRRTTTELWIG